MSQLLAIREGGRKCRVATTVDQVRPLRRGMREQRMLGFFFGFNARLGRLQYFLASLGLGVGSAIVATVVVVALAAIPKMPGLVLGGTIVVLIALFLWANVMLQAMRFRDIGWDPVCVIPG